MDEAPVRQAAVHEHREKAVSYRKAFGNPSKWKPRARLVRPRRNLQPFWEGVIVNRWETVSCPHRHFVEEKALECATKEAAARNKEHRRSSR